MAYTITRTGNSFIQNAGEYEIVADAAGRKAARSILSGLRADRIVDDGERLTFILKDDKKGSLEVRLDRDLASARTSTAPRSTNRRVVSASATADGMGEGFTGFGKVWTVRDEDASVYGFQPGADYRVKYAYFA